jgi:hypothetical protein
MQPDIVTLPLMQLASGDRLALQVYRFHGAQPGKKVYIQANLHGAEIAGNAVIYALIQWLSGVRAEQLSGEIWLVPVCNPLSVNTRSHHFSSGRYSPYDGRDWNRIFWDYEKANDGIQAIANAYRDQPIEQIATDYRQRIQAKFQAEQTQRSVNQGLSGDVLYQRQLQSLMLDADYVIDLHSSSNRGLTYLYYFPGRDDGARLFQLDFGLLMDAENYDGDAFDEAFMKPWLALEQALAALGRELRFDREAYTLELGTGMKVDPVAVATGLRGIQQYLGQKGLVGSLDSPLPPDAMPLYHRERVHKYYATGGGVILHRVSPGEKVQRGDRLYQLLSFNKTGELPQIVDVLSAQTGLIYDVSTNEAANQGEYILALIET